MSDQPYETATGEELAPDASENEDGTFGTPPDVSDIEVAPRPPAGPQDEG